jgi:hypothetical protein
LSSPNVFILYGKSFSSPFNPIPNWPQLFLPQENTEIPPSKITTVWLDPTATKLTLLVPD